MSTRALFLTIALLGPDAVLRAQPPASVKEIDARFVRDLHDKNIEDVLTLYAGDAVFVQPYGAEVQASGLRKLYETVTAAFDSDLHLEPEKLDDTASGTVETGTYTESLRHRDTGKVDQVSGKFRFVLRRDPGGHWLYTRMEWQ